MKMIDTEELVEIIKAKNINFIATAVTPWHAHGVDCCHQKLKDEGVELRGIVLIYENTESGYGINESHFSNEYIGIYRLKSEYNRSFGYVISDLLKLYRAPRDIRSCKSHKKLFIASPWHLNTRLYNILDRKISDVKFEFILFEEGLATYFPSNTNLYTTWCSINKPFAKRLNTYLLTIVSRVLNNRFAKKVKFSNLNLFIKNNRALEVNQEAVKYYRSLLKQRSSSHKADYTIFEDSVIICTMAYRRDEIYNDSDMILLRGLVSALKQKNIKAVIKPHPRELDFRERYAELKCEIADQNGLSMEMIMTNTKNIRSIVSFSSTSLVTAQLLFNIKAISVLKLLSSSDYSPQIKGEMDSFIKVFGATVLTPKSFDELTRCC